MKLHLDIDIPDDSKEISVNVTLNPTAPKIILPPILVVNVANKKAFPLMDPHTYIISGYVSGHFQQSPSYTGIICFLEEQLNAYQRALFMYYVSNKLDVRDPDYWLSNCPLSGLLNHHGMYSLHQRAGSKSASPFWNIFNQIVKSRY